MSPFPGRARLARNADLPYGQRYMAFRRAVTAYAEMRRGSFQQICAEVGARFGFDDDQNRPSFDQLAAALDYLGERRAAFLDELAEFEAERRREKVTGQRHLRTGQLERIFPRNIEVPLDAPLTGTE